MDRPEKLLAISQTLPGLENFLKNVLANEGLSEEADEQRREFLKKLELVSSPPTLPPRPAKLADRRGGPPLPNVSGNELATSGDESQSSVYSHYRNSHVEDPVDFASQQRELSRNYTFYGAYAGRRDLYGSELPVFAGAGLKPSPRGSTRSSSSDDTIYERLSIGGDSIILDDSKASTDSHDASKISQETSPGASNIAPRGAISRASVGKGKLATGWFKKETKDVPKVHEEVYVQDLSDNVIQGYLRDVKAKQRRWCIIRDEKLYIFKTRDEPAMQIIDLPNCNIGVDDKKKISYSFRLSQQNSGSPLVHLSIEEGHDLSPWMSAVMAAAVRRSSTYRPISPLDKAIAIGGQEERTLFPFGFMKIDIKSDEEGDTISNTYEIPIELLPEMISSSGYLPCHTSTPVRTPSTDDDGYDAPLPPLPTEAAMDVESSSSESSSDEEESPHKNVISQERKNSDKTGTDFTDSKPVERVKSFTLGPDGERIYDTVPEEIVTPRTDSHSDHSGHRLSFISDEDISSEPREDRSGSMSRKRTSTVLSAISQDSVGSDTEIMPAPKPRKTSLLYAPRMKRRRRQASPESERRFLQDQEATHSGVLFQKRPLGVFSKRYCKLIDDQFYCYRHPEDEKASLRLSLLGYDVTLTDSKESKRAYAFKISKPNSDSFFFSTDSRVSVERWIEVLSLATTGRQDIIAPYPPYFRSPDSADELEKIDKRKSLDSLSLSESYLSVESGDTQDEYDDSFQSSSPTKSISSMNTQEDPYDDIGSFAADEREDSDARELDSESQRRRRGRRSPRSASRSPRSPKLRQQRQRDRILKRRNEKISVKDSGTESPTTMSPPHSVFVSDSGPENKPGTTEEEVAMVAPETKDAASSTRKEKKGLADALKLKQSRFLRAHTLSSIVSGNIGHEATKSKPAPPRKRSIPSYTHLLPLFDKEGRFSGVLTEVRASKYSTTQLRRWCVVKNGALQLYNKQGDTTSVAKYNLVEMWLTHESDEARNKYSFTLHGMEDKTVKFQVTSKEDFDKWMSVLKVFTEIRVERPIEITTHEETQTQPTLTKSLARTKPDDTQGESSGKRSSIRLKFPQRMNVIEMFKKSNTSYDFENPNTEDIIPSNELKCVNYSGGYLTEICISDEDNYTWKQPRWVSVKESELLVFTDSSTGDPVKRMVLYNVNVDDTSEPERGIYRFKVHRGNEVAVFLAHDKNDLENWLKLLRSARDMYGRETKEVDAKCRIPSPKNVFGHNRTKSETLPPVVDLRSSTNSSLSAPEKRKSFGSTSMSTDSEGCTDVLMNGHLQEVLRGNEKSPRGSRGEVNIAAVDCWCVVTSEKIFIYDSEDARTPKKDWVLADVKVKEEHKEVIKGMYGFRVKYFDEEVLLQNANRDVITQWLSVLLRYCAPIENQQSPVVERLKSAVRFPHKSHSDSNLKNATAEQESKVKRTLSEGRASGRRLLRKISEDNILRKYSRPDLFKSASWKGSLEKLNVKMRDKSTLSSYARDPDRRFSCGSLFDSDGKYSGFLVEQTVTALCRSQVRRWCVVHDEFLYVYDQPRVDKARRVIPMINVKLTNESRFDEDVFVFRLEYEDQSVVFRVASRTDLEKWITAITVKIEVLKARARRQARRNVVIAEEVEVILPDSPRSSPIPSGIPSSFSADNLTSIHPPYVESTEAQEGATATVQLQEPEVEKTFEARDETESGVAKEVGNVDAAASPSSPHLLIVENLKRISLQDVTIETPQDAIDQDTCGDIIGKRFDVVELGRIKSPSGEAEGGEPDEEERTPHASASEGECVPSPSASISTNEPIYENLPRPSGLDSPQSANTLSGLVIQSEHLGDCRQHSHFEPLFVDLPPKRGSKHDLEPVYENVRFISPDPSLLEKQDSSFHNRAQDLDELFGLKAPSESNTPSPTSVTKDFERFSLQDRYSFASDYSGIVGENLLDEVGSCSTSDRSRSGTSSSRGSTGGSTGEFRAMNPSFDRDLLGDILGFPISPEEALEISDFCVRCDADADAEEKEKLDALSEEFDLTSPTLVLSEDNRDDSPLKADCDKKSTPVEAADQTFESLCEPLDEVFVSLAETQESTQPTSLSSLPESSCSSTQDTYFGCLTSESSEEFVDCDQEFTGEVTLKEADEKLPSPTPNIAPPREESTPASVRDLSFQTADSGCSVASSAAEEHVDTYFGRSCESELEQSSEVEVEFHPSAVDPRMDDESILLVGPVVSSDNQQDSVSFAERGDSDSKDVDKSDESHPVVLSSSQVDIIRAVTEAFQGIVDIREKHGAEDTKL